MRLRITMSPRSDAFCLFALLIITTAVLVVPRSFAAVILGDAQDKVALGSGFDPERGRFLDACVAGEARQFRGGSGLLVSEYSGDVDKLTRSVTKDLGVGIDLLVFSHRTAIDYFHRVASSTNRESTILEFTVQTGSDYLSLDTQLSSLGQRVAADSDSFARRKRCGTQFVQQVDLGYRFFLALTATFESTDEHEFFKRSSHTSLLFGLIKKSSTSIQEIKKYGKKVVVALQVMQEGGKQDVLNGLLARKRACTGDEIEQCLDLIDRLLNYVKDSANGFAAQIDPSKPYDPDDANGPSVLRYVTSSYEDAGIDDLQTAGAPADVHIARDQASAKIERLLGVFISNQQKLEALLVTPVVEGVRRMRLNYLRSSLRDLEAVARLGLEDCAEGRLELCLSREAYLTSKMSELDFRPIGSKDLSSNDGGIIGGN